MKVWINKAKRKLRIMVLKMQLDLICWMKDLSQI